MRTATLLLLGSALGWLLGSTRGPGGAFQSQSDPLAPLAPLVGKEWITRFPDGKLTDTQRYDWLFGKKFVRNPHQVRDESGQVVYEGETIYGYDATTRDLRWWYFNATGGWIDGTVEVEEDGGLVFEGTNHAGPGQPSKVRSTTSFVDAERWISTTWFWRAGEWQPERELEFRVKQ